MLHRVTTIECCSILIFGLMSLTRQSSLAMPVPVPVPDWAGGSYGNFSSSFSLMNKLTINIRMVVEGGGIM